MRGTKAKKLRKAARTQPGVKPTGYAWMRHENSCPGSRFKVCTGFRAVYQGMKGATQCLK